MPLRRPRDWQDPKADCEMGGTPMSWLRNGDRIGLENVPDNGSSTSGKDEGSSGLENGRHKYSKRKGPLPNGSSGYLHQPHLFMNLCSIVFFCMGCIMMLSSRHRTMHSIPDPGLEKLLEGEKFSGARTMNFNDLEEQTHKDVAIANYSTALQVEFVSFGNVLPLSEALNLDTPVSENEGASAALTNAGGSIEPLDNSVYPVNLSGNGKDVQLFIGITSGCCRVEDRQKRDSIRESWKTYALERHDNVDIKFVLSQPSKDDMAKASSLLADELRDNSDMVFVRGLDIYENLPKKTLGMLKYTLTSPKNYTHVLKTDDDCYVRVHKMFDALRNDEGRTIMTNVYMGCMESKGGFFPVRDPESKWHLSMEEFTDSMAREIWGTKYLAGWGYLLSRDVVIHVVTKMDKWERKPALAPWWYNKMKWEDVMMGLLLMDKIQEPQQSVHFKAAWRACTNETGIRHLDLDAPLLMKGLHEQQVSGLWENKTVQCSTGKFLAGDYHGWKEWRNRVAPPGQKV